MMDVFADKATFDIQFGHIERPIYGNTSWKQAKFETCAHKYVDISENGYGVSLLNDCKYGHDVIVRLYETQRIRTQTKLQLGFAYKEGYKCDLLENRISEQTLASDNVELSIKPTKLLR